MYGGGGGYDGASQFGGGGFIGSQNDGDARSPAPKSIATRKEGLRAVTIKQLVDANKAEHHNDVNSFHNVTCVGKITTVRESNNIVDMTIFDGSGTYVVHFYSSDVDDAMAQRIAEWRPGVYVRVYGNVSDFDDNWRIQAYNIRTITDFNEVTYHNLQAIFQHAHIAKGFPGSGAAQAQPAAGGAPMAQQQGMAGFGGAPDDIGNDGLTNLQRQVLAVFEQPAHLAASDGLTVELVAQQLPDLTLKQVRDTVAFLMDNANIYTVSDEHHYKSTKCD
ncbi:probable replication protein A 32 kDa subunit B [Coccomyxa sp. Obi]|nr:probable replication protein A 32 kDa subunit B [Coccomyxa sp. Obi]